MLPEGKCGHDLKRNKEKKNSLLSHSDVEKLFERNCLRTKCIKNKI